ncbi:hypothetical protein V1639_03730 [Pseudarthrobacter sp. J75]|uniref:LGFP repeat-containing protein n=1 Tax=unclassified Pseudarthrobacter TaxID=2647000 RepID=UPI002E81299E|nr:MULTISPECIES: hypothetical protein [unclassified Pseudarthrobacter]MEE2522214.1 hypothetical protein [Pseudarthrobacter sp. J47]MEE2528140.1 hypothetical protein [Pseudarthrobacter sp. J75]MEE2567842.1 hypothetical protein [Pseudarthrobacter sp. J64]
MQLAEREITHAYSGLSNELGAPTGATTCLNGNFPCWKTFTSGGLYVPAAYYQAISVIGETYITWNKNGGMFGEAAGFPTDWPACDEDLNCQQPFQRGTVYVRGAEQGVLLTGRFWSYYRQTTLSPPLGWPVDKATCSDAFCTQQFEDGLLYSRGADGPSVVRGGVLPYFLANQTKLGLPYADTACSDAGCRQKFDRATVYASPAGTFTMAGAIGAFGSWRAWPAADEQCGLTGGGCTQAMTYGRMYWAPVVGPSYIRGGIQTIWSSMGGERGALGYPLSSEECQEPICYQRFQSGAYLAWSATTGTQLTAGAIGAKFLRYMPYLGAPRVSAEQCGLRAGGCYQQFANGKMYWAPGLGAWPVRGGIEIQWRSRGAENGSLGYPISPEYCRWDKSGCLQNFERGSISWGRGLGSDGGYAPAGY